MKALSSKQVAVLHEMITEAMWEETSIIEAVEKTNTLSRSEAIGAESALAWVLIMMETFEED